MSSKLLRLELRFDTVRLDMLKKMHRAMNLRLKGRGEKEVSMNKFMVFVVDRFFESGSAGVLWGIYEDRIAIEDKKEMDRRMERILKKDAWSEEELAAFAEGL